MRLIFYCMRDMIVTGIRGGDKSKRFDLYFLNKIKNLNTNNSLYKQKNLLYNIRDKKFQNCKISFNISTKESGLFKEVIGFNKNSLSNEFIYKYKDIFKQF